MNDPMFEFYYKKIFTKLFKKKHVTLFMNQSLATYELQQRRDQKWTWHGKMLHSFRFNLVTFSCHFSPNSTSLMDTQLKSDMDTNLINFFLSLFTLLVSFAVRPLTVKIIQDLKFMSTKQSYDLRCEVRGSRPAPRVSWWLGSLQLTATKETVGIQACFQHAG